VPENPDCKYRSHTSFVQIKAARFYSYVASNNFQEQIFNFDVLIIQPSDMGVLRQLAEYFYLKKRDPNQPNTQWMKYMHGINRISIFMFLAAIIIMLVRLLFFRHH